MGCVTALVAGRSIKKPMNNNVLTYAEYQKRLKELKTPEDIASFAQELIAPALAGNMTPEKKEVKPDESKDEAPEESRKKRILLPKKNSLPD